MASGPPDNEDAANSGALSELPADSVARTEIRAPSGYRGVLSIPAFRRLWLAQLFSALGEAVALVALPLLAYDVTGSARLTGLIFVAQLLPRVVLAPIAGVLADRVNRRRLMIAADLGRAVVVVFLPFADGAGVIALLAALVAVGNAVARPAELAAVPAVVPAHQLVHALSASQVANSMIRIVGPALGAVVIGFVGPRPAFGIQAACFLISIAWLRGLSLPAVARAASAARGALGVWRDMGEGMRAVARIPVVRGTAAVEALWQTIVAILQVATVVYVAESLAYGDAGGPVYASLMATMSAGAAIGALAAGRVERRIGRPRLMAIGYLAPLLLVPAAFTPPLPIVFGLWFLLGFTDAWAVIAMQAYLAEAVHDALRGRVYASWWAAVTLGGAIAFATIGWLTSRVGPPLTIGIGGAVVGIGGPLLLWWTGAIATIRHSPDRGPATAAPARDQGEADGVQCSTVRTDGPGVRS